MARNLAGSCLKESELEGLKALGRAFRSEINRSDSRPDYEISRGIARVAAAGTAAGCQRKEAPLIAWVGLQQDVVGVRRVAVRCCTSSPEKGARIISTLDLSPADIYRQWKHCWKGVNPSLPQMQKTPLYGHGEEVTNPVAATWRPPGSCKYDVVLSFHYIYNFVGMKLPSPFSLSLPLKEGQTERERTPESVLLCFAFHSPSTTVSSFRDLGIRLELEERNKAE
ncbi:unnamed protein product [Citrullus colocynthis]|uniref:Uncharacterized protein n=1 Tax=Citrullus colocynthis TaxID=252529 RepID=A0ABP0YMR3_9ROSI